MVIVIRWGGGGGASKIIPNQYDVIYVQTLTIFYK